MRNLELITDDLERWLASRRLRRHAQPSGDPLEVSDGTRKALQKIEHVVV